MNFQNLTSVEKYDFYLDVAFKRANDKLVQLRQKIAFTNRLAKSRELEINRIQVIRDSLKTNLDRILKSFPSTSQLPIFYQELLHVTLDFPELKKSLGALNWAIKKIDFFFNLYKNKIKNTKHIDAINQYRREFNGRVSSVLKQIRNNLNCLEHSRKIMKNFPTIKTSTFTVAIIGFPNVGKTTLLYKLTGSKPEINSYAFTTKDINVSYINENGKKVQILDTPGTLNRVEKMNNIELQAYLAIKYCADLLVYVFDLTEPYEIEKQAKLFENLKKFGKNIIVYFSKTDILDKKILEDFKNKKNIRNKIAYKPEEIKSLLLESYVDKKDI